MTTRAIQNPIPLFFDTSGSPLSDGYLYFGSVGMNPETNQITVYWDSAATQPAAQPIRTMNGQPARNGVPAILYVGQTNYSISVKDKNGKLVYFAADADLMSGASLIDYDGGTVENVLDESKPMQSYTALRAYTGRATGVRITTPGIAGHFERDDTDITSADNGGTIIVDGSGRRWKRLISGFINLKWFGVAGDGVTNDSTNFQNALIAAAGWSLHIPSPSVSYVVTGLSIPSHSHLYGDGETCVIKMKSDANTLARMFLVDGLTGFAKTDIYITGVNFTGTCVADGFSEFRHLMYMYGVSNVTIERNWFNGFQGDAIGIAQTALTGANQNITIRNNVFDGINQNNRNAISVNGCTKLLIDDNDIMNTTMSTMPGGIDIEPNASYADQILDQITITNNRLKNIGGNTAAISCYLPIATAGWTVHPKNFIIENNTMDGVFKGIFLAQLQSANVDDSSPDLNAIIRENTISNATDRGMWLYGVKGVIVEENTLSDCANTNRIGWSSANRGCCNITFRKNTLYKNGTVDGTGISLYQSSRIKLLSNTFDDIGVATGGYGAAIAAAYGTNTNIVIDDNTIIATARTTTSIAWTGGSTIVYDPTVMQSNNFPNALRDGSKSPVGWFRGTGSPENVISAAIGSMYSNTSGGASTTLYVKTSGSFAVGWTSK